MMKWLFRGSAAAALLMIASVSGAEAQLKLEASPYCSDWLTGNYVRCSGAFDGNGYYKGVAAGGSSRIIDLGIAHFF